MLANGGMKGGDVVAVAQTRADGIEMASLVPGTAAEAAAQGKHAVWDAVASVEGHEVIPVA